MTARQRSNRPLAGLLAAGLAGAALFTASSSLDAQAGAGRSHARASVHRSQTVDVDREATIHVVERRDYRYDRWGQPIAAAAAFTAAAVAAGTVVASLPPNCSVTVVGAVTYQNCGGIYYQPSYEGTTVQYVVVPHP